jgi:hypothetical protein
VLFNAPVNCTVYFYDLVIRKSSDFSMLWHFSLAVGGLDNSIERTKVVKFERKKNKVNMYTFML